MRTTRDRLTTALLGPLVMLVMSAASVASAAPPANAKGKLGAHAPHPPPAPRLPPRPPVGPLPFLPTVARVSVDAAGDRLLLTEDVRLPRGEWTGGDLDFFVAYGAPGTPLAIDAQLYAPNGTVSKVVTQTSPRATPWTHALLGPRDMSGVILHVPASAFREATSVGDAILRVRSVISPARPDGGGGHEVLVRLGNADGEPIAVERIELGSTLGPLRAATAHLCGQEADPYPLAVSQAGQPRPRAQYPLPQAPWLASRRPTDSLCVRWVPAAGK
jgi:hypothetical protein